MAWTIHDTPARRVSRGRADWRVWLVGGLWLASSTALVARLGELTTHDGNQYRGHIRLATNLISVIDVDAGQIVHVSSTNWRGLFFSDDASSSRSVGSASAEAEASSSLPRPWLSRDLGDVRWPGTAARERGVFRLRSSGMGIQDREDSMHFMFKTVHGDSEIVARIIQAQVRDGTAQAGVMIRDGLTADAPNVFWGVTPPGGVMQSRETRGGKSLQLPQPDLRLPCWIKLKRLGDTFTAFKSRSGEKWRLAGEVTLPMAGEIQVGLAVAGGRSGRPNTVTFDQVQEAPSVRLSGFEPHIQLASGSTVVGRIQSADESRIVVYSALRQPAITTSKVACLLFRWLPAPFASKVVSGRTGVLLSSGELVDGEFRSIRNDRVTISSVLFGLRSYDVNHEVIAVVLGLAHPIRALYRVKTVNGSTLLGSQLALGWNEVELQEPLLGPWRLPLSELKEVERID